MTTMYMYEYEKHNEVLAKIPDLVVKNPEEAWEKKDEIPDGTLVFMLEHSGEFSYLGLMLSRIPKRQRIILISDSPVILWRENYLLLGDVKNLPDALKGNKRTDWRNMLQVLRRFKSVCLTSLSIEDMGKEDDVVYYEQDLMTLTNHLYRTFKLPVRRKGEFISFQTKGKTWQQVTLHVGNCHGFANGLLVMTTKMTDLGIKVSLIRSLCKEVDLDVVYLKDNERKELEIPLHLLHDDFIATTLGRDQV